MSKELIKEYLEDLDHYDEGMGIHSTSYEKCKERLIRLAEIDNAKPSEALECLDYIENKLGGLRYECERTNNHRCDDLFIQEHIFTTIKQALLKAQEQEKVLEILKPLCEVVETPVKKLRYLKMNGVVVYTFKTEEEFELLKAYFEKNIQK